MRSTVPQQRSIAARRAFPPRQIRQIRTAPATGGLSLLNSQRARNGLYPFIEDPELMALAAERLAANVARGNWQHNIRNGQFVGRFHPAKKEGCGNTYSPNRVFTCEWESRQYRYAGFAMQKVGNRYWQLLLLR